MAAETTRELVEGCELTVVSYIFKLLIKIDKNEKNSEESSYSICTFAHLQISTLADAISNVVNVFSRSISPGSSFRGGTHIRIEKDAGFF